MTEQHDELAALWQQQAVSEIDMTQIQIELTKQRWKQRLYMTIDILSPLPLILMLYFMHDELSPISLWTVIITLALTIPVVIYIAWLRRHAAFRSSQSTQSYLEVLQKQMANNEKIARFTKHSSWMSATVLVVLNLYRLLSGELTQKPDFSMNTFYFWITAGVVACAHCYFWARGRERRFKRRQQELASLQAEL